MSSPENPLQDAAILFVDDQEPIRLLVTDYFDGTGVDMVCAESAEAAMKLLRQKRWDVVITDMKMSGMSGIELLQEVKRNWPATEVVIVTGFGTVETAVEALKLGGYDYLQKPIKRERLHLLVARIMEKRRLELENRQLKSRLQERCRYRFDQLVGAGPRMQKVYDLIERISNSDTPILIQGESGTGKEVVAKVIHQNSGRSGHPFVAVNCGAIVEGLLESELFGHVKGAFTGAVSDKIGLFKAAQGGTLFLDEVSEIAQSLQVKLLRVLQEKRVRPVGDTRELKTDVRVIAATNRDLEIAVAGGAFRQDLFYRLNVVTLRLPSLAQRKEDIPLLIEHFLSRSTAQAAGRMTGIAPEAMDLLMSYSWPGNVRQLENVIERAFALGVQGALQVKDLPSEIRRVRNAAGIENPQDLDLRAHEINLIRLALAASGGNRAKAAKLLGVNTTTVYRKIEKYRIATTP